MFVQLTVLSFGTDINIIRKLPMTDPGSAWINDEDILHLISLPDETYLAAYSIETEDDEVLLSAGRIRLGGIFGSSGTPFVRINLDWERIPGLYKYKDKELIKFDRDSDDSAFFEGFRYLYGLNPPMPQTGGKLQLFRTDYHLLSRDDVLLGYPLELGMERDAAIWFITDTLRDGRRLLVLGEYYDLYLAETEYPELKSLRRLDLGGDIGEIHLLTKFVAEDLILTWVMSDEKDIDNQRLFYLRIVDLDGNIIHEDREIRVRTESYLGISPDRKHMFFNGFYRDRGYGTYLAEIDLAG